jgi:hypothetical protein
MESPINLLADLSIKALEALYFGHLHQCNTCNYDQDWCGGCEHGDNPGDAHACNCKHGGEGYALRKLLEDKRQAEREAKIGPLRNARARLLQVLNARGVARPEPAERWLVIPAAHLGPSDTILLPEGERGWTRCRLIMPPCRNNETLWLFDVTDRRNVRRNIYVKGGRTLRVPTLEAPPSGTSQEAAIAACTPKPVPQVPNPGTPQHGTLLYAGPLADLPDSLKDTP